MLSPLPKSTVISPGIPRNACITRRWIFSFTGEVLKELTDRPRSVRMFLLQDLLETSGEVRREIVQCFQQRLKELLRAGTVHAQLSWPGIRMKYSRRVRRLL